VAGSVDVIVFDVNETLSDMSPLATAFAAVGAPEHLAAIWFAGILRDGFAITAAGGNTAFAQIAQDSLGRLLTDHDIPSPAETTERIMDTLQGLEVHPDVGPGIDALRQVAELVTLSNGATTVADTLLTGAGVRKHFSRLLSVQDAPGWKPRPAAYEYAAARCGTVLQRMLLVAVHPWDIHGAQTAGMTTAWLNRTGARYPSYFTRPDVEIPELPALASWLG
jgi:2-haloacid dehalogenase